MRRGWLFVAYIALLAAIGVIDWITGTQLRVFPLYFAPITAVAWRLSRPYTAVAAVLATVTWHWANVVAGELDTFPLAIQVANACTMFVAFALVGFLFVEVRTRLRRERASSRTDALTDLPNRRGFLERADVLLAAGRRGARPITLAYLDLDHFKRVNDEQGHAAGDDALRAMGALLRTSTRRGDIIGRLGGDEFGAVFPDTAADVARLVLERIRATVAEQMAARGWPLTASIGAVSFPSRLDLEAALAAADATMYAVKREGRNRVRVDTPPMPADAAGKLPA